MGDLSNKTMLPTEFLNFFSISSLAEHELKPKLDTVAILLRNIDIKIGPCNRTWYLIKQIGRYRLVLHKLDAR